MNDADKAAIRARLASGSVQSIGASGPTEVEALVVAAEAAKERG